MARELTPEQHRIGQAVTARCLARKAERAAQQGISNPSLMHLPASSSSGEAPSPTAAIADPSVFMLAQQAPTGRPETAEPEQMIPTISAARLAANRANGALSKGALSPSTKAICAQNHTIHGLARHQNGTFKLLAVEDPIAFAALKQSLFDEHLPETTTESILVNAMAESNWLSSRAQRLQDTCMNQETGDITDKEKFSLYMRYQTTHTRAFHKSLNDLAKLRIDRRKAESGAEAQEMKKQQNQADLRKKEAQIRYQICLTAENAARSRDKIKDFEQQHELQLIKHGLPSQKMETKAEAA